MVVFILKKTARLCLVAGHVRLAMNTGKDCLIYDDVNGGNFEKS